VLTKTARNFAIAFAICVLSAMQAHARGWQRPSFDDEQRHSCTTEGYLRIAINPSGKLAKAPVSAILVDPQGHRLGYDPIRKNLYEDIPESTYTGDKGNENVKVEEIPSEIAFEVCNPVGGQYQLRLTGTQTGKYVVSLTAANREIIDSLGRLMALDSRAELPTVTARRGATQTFMVVYSRTPGVKARLKAATQ
jgi:hypothetical protein